MCNEFKKLSPHRRLSAVVGTTGATGSSIDQHFYNRLPIDGTIVVIIQTNGNPFDVETEPTIIIRLRSLWCELLLYLTLQSDWYRLYPKMT